MGIGLGVNVKNNCFKFPIVFHQRIQNCLLLEYLITKLQNKGFMILVNDTGSLVMLPVSCLMQ